MKVTDIIIFKIDRFKKGYVFTYQDFLVDVNNKEAIIKTLNRLNEKGKIAKLTKGRFYKPELSVYGKLPPEQYEVVKDLLEKDGKTIGYLTGFSVFNKLGLSTQVSNLIQIGSNQIRPAFKRDQYRISFVQQKNRIYKKQIPLYQILDSIRLIKKIPDSNIELACRQFLAIINSLSISDISTLVKLVKKYPPSTIALLGALLDELKVSDTSEKLYKLLNPISKYKYQGASKILSTTSKWNIV